MKLHKFIALSLLCLFSNLAAETIHRATLEPKSLVTSMRFDIMAKYIYALHHELAVQSDWATRLYSEHLQVWNNRKECCPKDIFHYYCAKEYVAKNGIESYTNCFKSLLDSIKKDGLDAEKSIVPIGNDRSLIDGAHRVAACLLYNKPVTCEVFSERGGYVASAEMFKNKRDFVQTGLSEKYLDNMALSYCTLKENTFIVSVFPAAVGRQAEVENILNSYGKIVYKKEIHINNATGSINFMRCLYDGEPFIGSFDNNFHGARLKAPCCYPAHRNGPTRIFLFECNQPNQIRPCKNQIRNLFNIGHDSVHINDTHVETIRIAQTVFNSNSVHLINHAQANKQQNFESLVASYRQWIKTNNINIECLCIDSSAVLSVYGLRDCRDLDILHHGYDNQIESIPNQLIGSHNDEMRYHSTNKDNIIFNPENYFYFKGLKFASLDIIKKMKTKRNEPKDQNDVNLINNLLT